MTKDPAIPFDILQSLPYGNAIALTLAVVLVVGAFGLLRKVTRKLPYRRSRALFTPAEQNFLRCLDRICGDHYRVFGKVRMADVVEVTPMRRKRAWWRAFRPISAKHFDYVLCDPQNMKVLVVVELDDRSHEQKHRQDRDRFVEKVCQSSGLPLVRISAARRYDTEAISIQINEAVRPETKNKPAKRAA